MFLDRRRLLLNAIAALVALPSFSRSVASAATTLEHVRNTQPPNWHPMVEAILDRARNASMELPDRDFIEDTIQRRAKATSYEIAGVKWLETPEDAHAYLRRQGLEALLKADVTRFWKFDDIQTRRKCLGFPKSAYDAQCEAEEIFRVDEREADVSAPKLKAKALAIASNNSAQQIFHTRAVSSQIGWLETVIARAAAYSIYQIELLLSSGTSEDDAAVGLLLNIFEAYEHGLLATWEAPSELVCVVCPHLTA